jgi:metal-sulfur cluster biosynthetic enzyme
MDKDEVMKILQKVNDPEHPMSIVDMKIVTPDDVKVSDDKVDVEFSPTVPYCPMGGAIGVVIKYALEKELGLPVTVKVKPGTHVQEELLNETFNDPTKYDQAQKRFLEMGLMEQCIVS